jgi:apolipoprotein N-acyltransferase
VVWTALEYVRGYLFGGLPWFLLGYTQHEALALIQVADLGGVWLVTALVAFVNAALVDGRRAMRWGAAAAVLLSIGYGVARLPTIETREGPSVAVVQPNIPQDIKSDAWKNPLEAERIYQVHYDLTMKAAEGKPDLIVWPEASVYRGLFWSVEERIWLETRWWGRIVGPADETKVPMLIGALVVDVHPGDREEFTNSALLVHPGRRIAGRFDKAHLVPFAEYVPLGKTFPWIRTLLRKYSGLYIPDQRPGSGFPVWEAGGRRFGAQVCFEAIFPEISREIAGNGAGFTVNISNDGWFRDSAELDQMQAMARFRAVENRIGFVRATNTGISSVIDPAGRATALLEVGGKRKEVQGVLAARVPETGASSLFRLWGNWIAWVAVGAAGAAWARRIFVDRMGKAA